MNSLELKEERLNLQNELTNMINESETRSLEENETSRLAEIRTRIDAIDAEIENIEKKNTEINNTNKNIKTERKMNLFNLIKEVADNHVSEENRAYVSGNKINLRAAIQADTVGMGAENVPVEKQPLELAIRNASVLSKVGATWFNGVTGDVKLVKYLGSNCAWADSENAQAADGASGFTEMTLEPKRLTSYIVISRQFLDQSPENAEAILINDLARSISEKIDETVFGAASGTTAHPAGLFNDTGYTKSGETALSAVTFDNILALEEAVEKKNGTDFIFVTEPSVKYVLRGTQLASGLQFVWENNEIDGRKAVVSNSVNAKSILCFDPKDLACASWGDGISLTVDPYTLADKNQIKIVVNYLFDSKLKGDRIAGEIFA